MIIPYLINGQLIDLVPKEELDKAQAINAELLERLQDRVASHLHASARDTETIQRQSVLLSEVAAYLNNFSPGSPRSRLGKLKTKLKPFIK